MIKKVLDMAKIVRSSGHWPLKLDVFEQGSKRINWIQSLKRPKLIIIGWSLVINGLGFLGQRH